MSKVIDNVIVHQRRPICSDTLQVNDVDRISSFLLSLIVLFGLSVSVLAIAFMVSLGSTRELRLEQKSTETFAGRGTHAPGFATDIEPPGSDELNPLAEPSVEQTFQLVNETVSSSLDSLDRVDGANAAGSDGTRRGDWRPAGPPGDGDVHLPRGERWELKFSARDRRNYAAQLEAFHIELAAIGGGRDTVDYVSNLVTTPTSRSGPGEAEQRLYFMNRTEGVLLGYDRAILQAAGVEHDGRVVLKFIPKQLEETLAIVETKYYLNKRNREFRITDIAKTVFECRPNRNGNGFEWVVIDQRYRGQTPLMKK